MKHSTADRSVEEPQLARHSPALHTRTDEGSSEGPLSMRFPSTKAKSMSSPNYSAPAAACAASLLLSLARASQPLSMRALAEATGTTKSLVFRVTKELEAVGYVRDDGTGCYQLGISALELGGAYISQSDYTSVARDVLQELSHDTGETVSLAALRGSDVLYLEKWEGAHSVVTISHVGRRLPANCTALGKALLAMLDDGEVSRLHQGELPTLTLHSIATPEELLEDLAATRQRGYAIEKNEVLVGRACIATALDPSLVGPDLLQNNAVSISMPLHRFESDDLADLAEQLMRARNQINANWKTRGLFQPRL